MERVGHTLQDVIARGPIAPAKNVSYALNLLDAFEALHSRGLVFNDLKPDNICVEARGRLKLIDLGFCTRFNDEAGKHLPVTTINFRGNFQMASPHQLQLRSTSRRDDLISLVYLLVLTSTR